MDTTAETEFDSNGRPRRGGSKSAPFREMGRGEENTSYLR